MLGDATGNVTATFTMEEVRFDAAKGAKVYDIWGQRAAGALAAGAESFTTRSFGPHDSVFLLLEPTAAAQ